MIKPTHYDDDGYPIQWVRSNIPSNTLASIHGLADDCRKRRVLGRDVEIRLTAFDETNTRIKPARIVRMIREGGGNGLVGLVGVQSNQFPRAMDIARPLREAGLQVAIGGFHVSGCLAMLDEVPPEIREAQDLGISIFAGEVEEMRLDEVFRDACNGGLKRLYNYMHALPTLEGEPTPFLPRSLIERTEGVRTSFDLGRGCPYLCSFCTIINVQGRKSRFRDPDDLERIIRDNEAQGIHKFFITDDNLARNKNWEALFDRLIRLREEQGFKIKLVVQVDALCHKIENFIEKASRAGVTQVFIGLENINPDNLLSIKKTQNRITEYRALLQKWREHGVSTYAGYILGFANDTKESILRDIEIIKRELPLDLLEFFFLTPLPGCADHKNLLRDGVWMDADLNKYDLNHRVTHHERMTDQEWEDVYRECWHSYYTPKHVETIARRAAAHPLGNPRLKIMRILWFYLMYQIEDVHPLEGGRFRRKYRRDRRSELPMENPFVFYPWYWMENVAKLGRYAKAMYGAYLIYRRVMRDPRRAEYTDTAITPGNSDEFETLSLFKETAGSRNAVERARRIEQARATV